MTLSDADVMLLLEGAPPTVACRLPACPNEVRYRRQGAGRQPYFCSDSCRAAHSQERERLLTRWEDLQALRERTASATQRASVDRLRREVSWQMEAYGERLLDRDNPDPYDLPTDVPSFAKVIRAFLAYLVESGHWDALVPLPHEYESYLTDAQAKKLKQRVRASTARMWTDPDDDPPSDHSKPNE